MTDPRPEILRRAYAMAELEGTLDCFAEAVQAFHRNAIESARNLSVSAERWEDAWDLAVHRPAEAA